MFSPYSGNGWMCEVILDSFWFSPPILGWSRLGIKKFVAFEVYWRMWRPLILMSLLLSCFCAWQLLVVSNEVNTFVIVSHILPIVVVIYWSIDKSNFVSFVIYFVTLGSSTSSSSCGTSTMENVSFDVLACHFLGDAPPFLTKVLHVLS